MLAVLLFTLLVPGPGPEPESLTEASAPDEASAPAESLAESLAELAVCVEQADGTAESLAALEGAIGELEGHGSALADDDEARRALYEARLLAARLHLAFEDELGAERAMDAAIRSAMGDPLPAEMFGPVMQELYERRVAALGEQGFATIEVECATTCELVIDEHLSPNPSGPLLLGNHRVWVLDRLDPALTDSFEVELDQAGAVERLTHVGPPPEPEPVDHPPEPPPARRMLPRWAELLGAAAGVGLLVTGGARFAIDGRCRTESCTEVFDTSPQSQILMAAGAALALTSGVMLTIDEVRIGGARAHQATLTWTLRF